MSRIEANLLSKIGRSINPQDRAVFCSRLAIYYFHKGDCESAHKLVDEVRDWSKTNEALDVMVYVNLAEATERYQSAYTIDAIQKAKRAYALSSASGKPELIALSAIWLAHLQFNDGEYVHAVNMIAVGLKTMELAEALARTRCYTLMADLLSFCGKADYATPWYAKARSAAVEEGDEIAIGQIIYNSAVFRFNNVRLSKLRGEEISEELRLIELMIGSSSHYDVGVNSTAFRCFLPMLNAQLLMLRRDYTSASRIFAQWLQSSSENVDVRVSTLCRVDFALCLAYLGDVAQAVKLLGMIEELGELAVPPDEAAMICNQCACIYSIAGDLAMSEGFDKRAKTALAKHEKVQYDILSLISSKVGIVFDPATN